MPAILVTGLLLCRTRCFFPSGGWNHCRYSMCLPMEGWPGCVGLGCWLHTEVVCPSEDVHPS